MCVQPLTSFLSGIEFISQIVVDWDEHICDPAKYPHALSDVGYSSENLNAIHGCLDSIRNTNSFMIMTINRCIDFTKASKGLKLIPKLETIELQETIDLPIKVMRDFKSNLTINLLPIAGDICTHIISDRQWLQENLLCLMSNAVKYSSKGKVEISVKLVTMPIVQRAVPESVPKSANSPKRPKNSFKVLPGAGAVAGSISAGSGEVAESYSSRSRGYEEGGVGTSNRETRTTDPDSTKIRKLSNFVFNHAYSNIGRSRVFSEKILSDIDKERDSGDDVINYAAIEEGEGGVDEDERADSSTKEEGESGQFLRIEVEDTGIGLSEEAMQTLFNPFKQAQRLAGGTGLGLYSLAKRIEALSGHYGVSHRRDQNPGSLFWFAIPYRPDTAFAQSIQLKQHKNHLARASSSRVFMNHAGRSLSNRMANAGHAAHGGAGGDELIDLEGPGPSLTIKSSSSNSVHTDIDRSSSGVLRPTSGRSHTDSMSIAPEGDSDAPKAPKLNILLVDDSLSILKMTAMMLRRSGHKVEQADNGAAGLELILQGYEKKRPLSPGTNDTPYDVVLMDLQMPIMDGLEAVRRLRAAEKTLHKKSPELSVQDLDDEGKSDERGTMRGFFFGRNSNKRIVVSPENASSPRTGERRRSSIALKHQLVIGVSANSDNDTMVEAMKSGFDAFIGKPFSIDAFYEVLQTQQDKFRERNSTAGGAQKK